MVSRQAKPEADAEAVRSLLSSIEANDRMIDVDRLLSQKRQGSAGAEDPDAFDGEPSPADAG